MGAQRDELVNVSDQFEDQTDAGNMAATLIRIAELNGQGKDIKYDIYHLSGPPNVNWFDFANCIFDIE